MNTASNSVEKDLLHDMIEDETRSLDVVASWETLCDTYRQLEFTDQLTDAVKIEEFKWIIKQMNTFLSRQRKILMPCSSIATVMESLSNTFTPEGKTNIDNRKSLTYQKLRQRWVVNMMSKLQQMMMEMEDTEDSKDGWSRDATD